MQEIAAGEVGVLALAVRPAQVRRDRQRNEGSVHNLLNVPGEARLFSDHVAVGFQARLAVSLACFPGLQFP